MKEMAFPQELKILLIIAVLISIMWLIFYLYEQVKKQCTKLFTASVEGKFPFIFLYEKNLYFIYSK